MLNMPHVEVIYRQLASTCQVPKYQISSVQQANRTGLLKLRKGYLPVNFSTKLKVSDFIHSRNRKKCKNLKGLHDQD